LKQWFEKYPAWSLVVDKDVARLRKTPADLADDTRPAIDTTSGTPFSKRKYALVCLALAALEAVEGVDGVNGLEGSDVRMTLGQISEMIADFAALDPRLKSSGFHFDISNYDHRRDLVHAIRLLLEIGLLQRINGDEQAFLQRTGVADALYEVDRAALALLLNVSCSPSALEAADDRAAPESASGVGRRSANEKLDQRIAGVVVEAGETASEDGRNRQVRTRMFRALLDDPITYYSEWSDEERAQLQRQRGHLIREVAETTGLIPEVRREGIAMVDRTGDLTDLKLAGEGTDGHVALLLAEWLAEHAVNWPGAAVSLKAVEQHVSTLIQSHGSRWRRAVRDPGAIGRVTEEALARLRGLRLIQITGQNIVPLAASGRYAAFPPIDSEKTDSENQE
jgi:uncharacterized protein (TIGR02678 family)